MQSDLALDPALSSGPGLTALVVYLRPAPRAEAVTTLVDLGLFVREFDATFGEPAERILRQPPQLSVIYAEDRQDHHDFIRASVREGHTTLAVIAGKPGPAVQSAVAPAFVIDERVGPMELRQAFQLLGQRARRSRDEFAQGAGHESTVFGCVRFRPNQPWLARGRDVAALSPTEHDILRALVEGRGAVVSKEVLRRALSSSGDLASEGYLKTVILRIRRKADRLGGDSTLLSSVRGCGYVLKA